MEYVYEDIALITGECGVMTHQLPNAIRAIQPYLREKITDARFWDGKNDPTHTGDIDVPTMNAVEQEAMWKRYAEEQETKCLRN
jgi:cytochrome c peroxidase